MERKSIKIHVPDGYEIDKKESTFEEIIFKKIKPNNVKSWKDYCNKHRYIEKDIDLHPKYHNWPTAYHTLSVESIVDSRISNIEREAIRSYKQLQLLKEDWINNENPGWYSEISVGDTVYVIIYDYFYERYTVVERKIEFKYAVSNFKKLFPFGFPTFEMAKEFLNTFDDLFSSFGKSEVYGI